MKLSIPPTWKRPSVPKQIRYRPPPVPLAKPEERKLAKDQYMTFSLRTKPTDRRSPSYDLSVPYFHGTEKLEYFFILVVNHVTVCHGLNLAVDSEEKYNLFRKMLLDKAATTFDSLCVEMENNNMEKNDETLNLIKRRMVSVFAGPNALARQKRYMRRFMVKPRSMSTRDFEARLNELIKYCGLMEGGDTFQFDPSELLDIVEFSAPYEFQAQLLNTGVDTSSLTVSELVTKFTMMEEAAHFGANGTYAVEQNANPDDSAWHVPRKKRKTQSNRASLLTPKRRSRAEFFCSFHGPNRTHSTADCRQIIAIKEKAIHDATMAAKKSKPKTSEEWMKKQPWYGKKFELNSRKELTYSEEKPVASKKKSRDVMYY